MNSVLVWFISFRAASLIISAALYFMVFLYCADSKGYLRYYSRVRFVLKTLLTLFYCVLLDIAEMWSRSYRTFGYKEVKKGFGRASIWLV